jgi:hypothetical protein
MWICDIPFSFCDCWQSQCDLPGLQRREYVPCAGCCLHVHCLSHQHGKNGEAALWVYLSAQELQQVTMGVTALLVFIFKCFCYSIS